MQKGLGAKDIYNGRYMLKNIELNNDGLVMSDRKMIADENGSCSLKNAEEISCLCLAKKELVLEESPSDKTWLVFLAQEYPNNKQPLVITINDYQVKLMPDELKGHYLWRKIEVNGEYLQKGVNQIVFRSMEASTGWSLAFQVNSREIQRSYKSIDGQTWSNRLGHDNNWNGEYLVRLVINSQKNVGLITSPVFRSLHREKQIKKIYLKPEINNISDEASINCQVRIAYDKHETLEWSDWLEVENNELSLENPDALQWRILLENHGLTNSPVIKAVAFELTFSDRAKDYISDVREIAHPFRGKDHQKILDQIIKQEGLRELLEPIETEFGKFLALRKWVSRQWKHHQGNPYPGWNPLIMLEWLRDKKPEACGFCVIHNQLFYQLCLGVGLIARPVIITRNETMHDGGHFVSEVYSNDYQKWMVMDANYDIHYDYNGQLLNALELHNLYLEGKQEQVLVKGDPSYHPFEYEGAKNLSKYRFFGIIPLEEVYDSIYNGPVEHGQGTYRWDGFLWWYDQYSPKQLQFTRYTNRPQMLYYTPQLTD